MVSNISNPDDKIATYLSSKTTINNRTATRVISATGPHLAIKTAHSLTVF